MVLPLWNSPKHIAGIMYHPLSQLYTSTESLHVPQVQKTQGETIRVAFETSVEV